MLTRKHEGDERQKMPVLTGIRNKKQMKNNEWRAKMFCEKIVDNIFVH